MFNILYLDFKGLKFNSFNEILNALEIEFGFKEMPMGGAALDLTGVPLPEETLSTAQQSDAVLLGAIGGYKYTS